LTNYIDFPCLPLIMTPTIKKELNTIKKICKVNKSSFGENNQCHDNCKYVL
jgi:MinD superfamily P-loop ATPase